MSRSYLWILLSMLVFIAACGKDSQNIEAQGLEEEVSPFDVNLYPPEKTVCDPFSKTSDDDQYFHRGIRADLYTVAEGERYNNVDDYIQNGTRSDRVIFLSELNVPTRKFEMGFVNPLGGALKDDSGEVLIEDFALRMRTVFKLREDQAEGRYEFAILSDDGATWEYRDTDGVYREMVNNDGQTPTRMGCSTVAIDLKQGQSVAMNLKYFQGPRYHISLVAMMRKLADGESPGEDSLCGVSGNRKFFDYENNSEPQKAYKDLLARGWEVLKPQNFELPLVFSFNPCMQGQKPSISNVAVKTFEGESYLTWQTDIKSTSQVVYTNAETGEVETSQADNVLRKDHKVSLKGADQLSSSKLMRSSSGELTGTLLVQPMSVSNTLGRTIDAGLETEL